MVFKKNIKLISIAIICIIFVFNCSLPGNNSVSSNKGNVSNWGDAYSIFVNNGIVYIAGSNNSVNACYWSDTNETALDSSCSYADTIYVYNGTVYTAGDAGLNYPYCYACYWATTNGFTTKTILDSNGGGILSIFIYNGTIYAAGEDSFNNACYWTVTGGATNKTILAYSGSFSAEIIGIYINNGIVYAAGYDGEGNACFWTGSTKTILDFFVNSIYVDNSGTVYTAGGDGFQACYCTTTGGVSTKTILDSKGGCVNSIFVYNSTIYSAGYDNSKYACYWTNGIKTILDYSGGFAKSIFVNNGTVYTAGDDGPGDEFQGPHHACLWIGTTKTIL